MCFDMQSENVKLFVHFKLLPGWAAACTRFGHSYSNRCPWGTWLWLSFLSLDPFFWMSSSVTAFSLVTLWQEEVAHQGYLAADLDQFQRLQKDLEILNKILPKKLISGLWADLQFFKMDVHFFVHTHTTYPPKKQMHSFSKYSHSFSWRMLCFMWQMRNLT